MLSEESFLSLFPFLKIFNSLPFLYHLPISCVRVCVHIPGTDTRPRRLFHHWRLCASCCGKPSSQACLLRRHLAVVTDICSNVDLNMNWQHVKKLITITIIPPHHITCFTLLVFMCLFCSLVIILAIVSYISAVRSSQSFTSLDPLLLHYCSQSFFSELKHQMLTATVTMLHIPAIITSVTYSISIAKSVYSSQHIILIRPLVC